MTLRRHDIVPAKNTRAAALNRHGGIKPRHSCAVLRPGKHYITDDELSYVRYGNGGVSSGGKMTACRRNRRARKMEK